MNDIPPLGSILFEESQRSNLQLTLDVINWFIAFTLTTLVPLFLVYVIIAWTIGFNLAVILSFVAVSVSLGIIALLLGILFVGGIKNIPQFSWKEAITLKYSLFRATD